MARKIDIGGYFEKLTSKAKGGRRLDDGTTSSKRRTPKRRTPNRGTSNRGASNRGTSEKKGRSVKDVLDDALAKSRSTAKRTADRVRPRRGRPAQLPPEGVVTIEYSPRIDGDPDPGEVVWAWVPFEEDPEQGKDRPVVIVGRRGRHLVGVPLTTKRSGREAQIAIGKGDWDPKRRNSYARIWRMCDLDPDRMRREGAVLGRTKFDKVVAAVDEYYEIRHVAVDDDFDYEY